MSGGAARPVRDRNRCRSSGRSAGGEGGCMPKGLSPNWWWTLWCEEEWWVEWCGWWEDEWWDEYGCALDICGDRDRLWRPSMNPPPYAPPYELEFELCGMGMFIPPGPPTRGDASELISLPPSPSSPSISSYSLVPSPSPLTPSPDIPPMPPYPMPPNPIPPNPNGPLPSPPAPGAPGPLLPFGLGDWLALGLGFGVEEESDPVDPMLPRRFFRELLGRRR